MILIQKLACEPNLSMVSEWALMKTCKSFRVNVHTFVFHILPQVFAYSLQDA